MGKIETDIPRPTINGKQYGLNIAGPSFNGFYIVMLINYASHYTLVLVTHDITSQNIANLMKDQWELYGYPSGIVTETGAQFTSREFES